MLPSYYDKLPRHFTAGQVYLVQLSAQQQSALSKVLPTGFSLEVQLKNKVKHITKKKVGEQIVVSNLHHEHTLSNSIKQIPKQIAKNNKKANKEEIKQAVKPCFKILQQLKGYKHSWPFLAPVDPNTLGIPEYFEIVVEPMDLETVQKKLKSGKYSTPREFYDDINLIIKNSYNFNYANEQFLKITNDFEKYFFRTAGSQAKPIVEKKIVQKPVQPVQIVPSIKPQKKKKKGIPKDILEAMNIPREQKQQLADNIIRLAKEHLDSVRRIVFDQNKLEDNQDQFDIQKIGYKKIRELQKLVRTKISQMETRKHIQIEKKETVNLDDLSSDESEAFIP